jgi:hypothetical protein
VAELESLVRSAAESLDAHVREIVAWHFSAESGTPHWLEWRENAGWDPVEEVRGFADLLRFENFDGELLRTLPHEVWIPRAYQGRAFSVFETGGTTGMPKQRLSWDDYKIDYEEFSETLADEDFPRGEAWLMIGPTGPRRLRLAIEHLANFRGSPCYFVDLDPRWVKKLISAGKGDQARDYMEHVVDQALLILRNRKVGALFTTPKLLEALSEKISIPDAGIRGVFCGGTTMDPQNVRFLIEEVLEERVKFVPTYGNTLMGLAASEPLTKEHNYSIIYHAPQPRAVLRVVDPDQPETLVDYGEWGRVELTTLTRELFLPRFLERDLAIRQPPCARFPWDGAGEVGPFQEAGTQIVEGVY